VVFGRSYLDTGTTAFVWDDVHGIRNIQQLLSQVYGLDSALIGWKIDDVVGVSTDGRVLAGSGLNPYGNAAKRRLSGSYWAKTLAIAFRWLPSNEMIGSFRSGRQWSHHRKKPTEPERGSRRSVRRGTLEQASCRAARSGIFASSTREA
jgi:hypothetical protein